MFCDLCIAVQVLFHKYRSKLLFFNSCLEGWCLVRIKWYCWDIFCPGDLVAYWCSCKFFYRQLVTSIVFSCCAPFIIDFIFARKMLLISKLFWLNNVCNLWCSGECLSSRLKKNLPSFVITFLVQRSLNKTICFLHCCEFSFFWSCF